LEHQLTASQRKAFAVDSTNQRISQQTLHLDQQLASAQAVADSARSRSDEVQRAVQTLNSELATQRMLAHRSEQSAKQLSLVCLNPMIVRARDVWSAVCALHLSLVWCALRLLLVFPQAQFAVFVT